MDINNKRIILTGASSGIGKEMLNLLLTYKNVRIIAVARHIENNPTVTDKVFPFSADVSSAEGIDKLFTFAQQTFGDTDLFIANAGFAYIEKLGKPDWQHIEDIFSLNVFSPIYALEKLLAESNNNNRSSQKQKGIEKSFACVVSGAGLASLPAYSLYCSTKAGLHHFINTYRYEKPEHLQITAVYPVATRTDFFDKATGEGNTPLPFPTQDAKTVARKIIRGIEKGKKTIYPSLLFRIGYPIGRAFPVLLHLYSLMEKRKVKKWLG